MGLEWIRSRVATSFRHVRSNSLTLTRISYDRIGSELWRTIVSLYEGITYILAVVFLFERLLNVTEKSEIDWRHAWFTETAENERRCEMDALKATYAGNQMMAAEGESWYGRCMSTYTHASIGLDTKNIIACHCWGSLYQRDNKEGIMIKHSSLDWYGRWLPLSFT